MAEFYEVLIFCALYSGVVLFALATTVSQKVLIRNRKR